MKVIPPVTITDPKLTSSTVFETVPTAYNAGTTYADGDIVSVSGANNSHTVYESLQGSNTGNTPASSPLWWVSRGVVYGAYNAGTAYVVGDYAQDNTNHILYLKLTNGTGDALTDTTKWQNVGPTNKWAMFDLLRSTKTVVPNSMTVVIAPGVRTDSFAITGLQAASYTLTVASASYGGTIYTATGTLSKRNTQSWYQYFFGEFTYKGSVAFFNIPPYTDAVYTLTLTGTAEVSCGAFVVGMHADLGTTIYTPISDALNFSTIARDSDGVATLTARRNVPKTRQNVIIPKRKVDGARKLRDELNAAPAIWFGIDDGASGYYDALTILGIYKEFSIAMDLPEQATITLELEEI